MKSWQFFAVLLLGVVSLGLSVATVALALSNEGLQRDAQARQTRIEMGILGAQSQQITTSLLQDMAAVAARNTRMRELLAKHGYTIPAASEASGLATKDDVKSAATVKTTEEE